MFTAGGGGENVPTVTSYTLETEINITGLVPDVRYRVFVRAENELYDVDNTTSRSNNITVTLPEGGEYRYFCYK